MGRSNTGSSANYLSNTSAVVTVLPITIAGWFKATVDTTIQCICTVGASGGTYVALLFDGANGLGYGAGKVIADPASSGHEAYSAGAITDTTTWHHLAVVFTSTTSRTAYLDGTAGTTATSTVLAPSGWNITDGGIFPPTYSVLNGAISDVAIWNTALTGAQITSLAGGAIPSSVASANLAAYWPLSGSSPEPDSPANTYPWTVTGTMPYVAGPLSSGPSFSTSPSSIPANHSGPITLTLTGTSTTWTSGSTVSITNSVTGTTTVTKGTWTQSTGTSATLTVTTGTGTGTFTITIDGVASPSLTVDAASFIISPTTGSISTTPRITATGTNTLWFSETASTLFAVSGGSGASISSISVTSNTAATFTLTVGSSSGTLTITDTPTGDTATLIASTGPATYYISPSGSDSNNGTSSGTAWQTIAKVNGYTPRAGDTVLFQGGQSFSGNILFTGVVATPQLPFTVGSYGTGNATISCGSSYGVRFSGCSGVSVSNLTITGAGVTSGGVSSSDSSGVEVQNPLVTNTQLAGIYIDNLTISGCYGGIEVRGHSATVSPGTCSGFKDVRISNCVISGCCSWGIFVRAIPLLSYTGSSMTVAAYNAAIPTTFPSASNNNYLIVKGTPTADVYISDCHCYNIYGDITWTSTYDCHTGDGIMVHSAIGATVERCQVWNCGQSGYGPAGIWFQETTNGLARYCIVENQQSGQSSGVDGDGYDADGGCVNCTFEACIACGCTNAGFLTGPYSGGAVPTGTIVRNCICAGNVRSGSTSSYAEVAPYGGATVNIVNCTFYLTAPSSGSDTAYADATGGIANLVNCIVVGVGGQLLASFGSGTTSICLNNIWYAASGTFQMAYGGTTYNTFAAWQAASGMEIANSVVLGQNVNPQLSNPGAGAPSMPAASYTITSFDPTSSSPAIGAGIDPLAYYSSGSDPGKVDFHGYPNRSQLSAVKTGYDIGAVKYNATSVLPAGTGVAYYPAAMMMGL